MRSNSTISVETTDVGQSRANSLFNNILRINSLNARICDSSNRYTRPNYKHINILEKVTEKNMNPVDRDSVASPAFLDASMPPRETEPIDLDAFAWTYAQKSGELQQDGKPVATGYSGSGAGKNNPAHQNVPNVGPIPQGDWTIAGPPADTADHGPYVLKLHPAAATETFGRSGFLVHGDSKEHPGCASHGCVILPRAVREQVWNSGDRELEVLAEIPLATPARKRGE